jgi:hypothetical protein
MFSDDDGLVPAERLGGGFIRIGETFFWMGLSWTARNPAEALAAMAVIANPTMRGVLLKVLRHQLGQLAVDLRFYARLTASDLAVPFFTRARTILAATVRHPITIGTAAVICGATLTTANQQMINNNGAALNPALRPGGITRGSPGGQTQATAELDLTRSDLPRFWTPFGGLQFGTAIS